MTVTLTSTTKIVTIEDGTGRVPARIWEGTTDSGIAVVALVTRIAVHRDQDAAQFERELLECRPPSPLGEAYPLRLVL